MANSADKHASNDISSNNSTVKKKLSEEEKDQLRSSANSHISQICNYAALIIALIALASFILGQFNMFFIQIGTLVAIALLAIAAINNPTRK